MKWLQKLQQAYGSQPTAQPIKPDANGNMPNATHPAQPTPAPVQELNPLDLYGQLSQNSINPGKPAPAFTIPTETIQAAASKLNFLGGIPQDAMAKLQAGDLSALPDVLNAVGRQAYQTAVEHQTAVTGQFLDTRFQHEQEAMDNRMSGKLVASNLKSIEHLHPVAQGMFKQTVEGLRQQYPGASQAELENAGWEIFQDMSGQFDRNGQQAQQQQAAVEVDYDAMGGFGGDESST